MAKPTPGAIFVEARQSLGLSQAQLAEKLGIAQPTLWAYEHNRAFPARRRWPLILKLLGIDPARLA